MSDFPNRVEGAGSVRYINPDTLNKNPTFTHLSLLVGHYSGLAVGILAKEGGARKHYSCTTWVNREPHARTTGSCGSQW